MSSPFLRRCHAHTHIRNPLFLPGNSTFHYTPHHPRTTPQENHAPRRRTFTFTTSALFPSLLLRFSSAHHILTQTEASTTISQKERNIVWLCLEMLSAWNETNAIWDCPIHITLCIPKPVGYFGNAPPVHLPQAMPQGHSLYTRSIKTERKERVPCNKITPPSLAKLESLNPHASRVRPRLWRVSAKSHPHHHCRQDVLFREYFQEDEL